MKIMVYSGPKQLTVQSAPELVMKENEVRIQTICSGLSHGTEMSVYRGSAPFFRRKYDADTRLFVDADTTETWQYPIRSCDPGVWYMGYANVGEVIEIGSGVKNVKLGDIVCSSAPHQSEVVKAETDVIVLPEGVKPEYGVFFTNLMTTFNGILDSHIKLGDTVVVMGLGVLGQLVSQMAKMSGAFKVYGIDMFETRLEAALENGCDKVFNPVEISDIAKEIRKLTNNKGADVVIEVTGNSAALNEAVRIAAPETSVIALSWYQGMIKGLDLSEEFHHNRIGIKQSQTNNIDPAIKNLWDDKRRTESCLKILKGLKLDNLITHKIPYDEVASAYEIVDTHPEKAIQVLITY